MDSDFEILERIRVSARAGLLYLPHAVRQMSRPDRMIKPSDVRSVLSNPRLIEDYPEDVRGHSALIGGVDPTGRPVHVVCSPKAAYLAIITAYLPDDETWDQVWTRRRTR